MKAQIGPPPMWKVRPNVDAMFYIADYVDALPVPYHQLGCAGR